MIVKKHLSIFLAFFLLVSNLGLAFNVHYCDDEIASVSLSSLSSSFEVEKDCCGKIEKFSKCCKTKLIKTQEKSDQIIVQAFSFHSDFIPVFEEWNPLVFLSKYAFQNSKVITYCCDANAPPLYKLYCKFTLFG